MKKVSSKRQQQATNSDTTTMVNRNLAVDLFSHTLPPTLSVNANAARERLALAAASAVNMAPAKSTKAATMLALANYRKMCREMDCIHRIHGDFYPPNNAMLVAYASQIMCIEKLSAATAKARIGAVRNEARMRGMDDPYEGGHMSRFVAVVIKGATKELAITTDKKKLLRIPAPASTVRQLLKQADVSLPPFDAARFKAIVTYAYTATMRIADMIPQTQGDYNGRLHLRTNDVSLRSVLLSTGVVPVLVLQIKSSKTDIRYEGAEISIIDQTAMSVVGYHKEWMAQRGTIAADNASDAYFVKANGKPESTQSFRNMMAKVTAAIEGFPTGVLPHSFRKGSATVLGAHGYSDATIAAAGRWKSSCFRRYISPTVERQNEVFATLATSTF
jgi:hypothetical protein